MSDFGLTEDMYSFNYYRPESTGSEEKVPIKWMAPESIETNVFDESTDVVSHVNSYSVVNAHVHILPCTGQG